MSELWGDCEGCGHFIEQGGYKSHRCWLSPEEVDRLKARYETKLAAAVEALEDMFELVDSGFLQRSTARDHELDWVLSQIEPIKKLKYASDVLDRLRGKK